MHTSGTFADMHIHSCASDSTNTPADLVQKLSKHNIGIASLTDHNDISNVAEFVELAQKNDIIPIPGVELNARENGIMYHILAYCFDPSSIRIRDYAAALLTIMKKSNRDLIETMDKSDSRVSLSEYDEYTYDRTRGGWESINYLYDKGVIQTPIDGLKLYTKHGHLPVDYPYPGPGEVIEEILSWGAFPVLAHPNYYLDQDTASPENITYMLDMMKSYGIHGVECHYPTHNELMTDTTVRWCKDNDMMITLGSDDHGDFIKGKGIGTLNIPISQLRINKILEACNDQD